MEKLRSFTNTINKLGLMSISEPEKLLLKMTMNWQSFFALLLVSVQEVALCSGRPGRITNTCKAKAT